MMKGILAAAVAVLAGFGLGGTASADPSQVDGSVTAADLDSAQRAAAAPEVAATVGKFLGQAGGRSADVRASVGGTAVGIYELSPEFVAGGSDKVGKLSYLAVPATGTDGSTASVWTVKDPAGQWVVANIASGDLEFRHARKVPQGGVLLREPQTNTWYAVAGGSVHPLAGGKPITLAEYQRQVQARYGDKLPGSIYDRSGQAGGYGNALPPSAQMSTPDRGSEGSGAPWIVLGVLVVGVAAVAFMAATSPASRRR
ncbi:hypothetical protein SAMN05192558_108111 [Actinokineospora alba]|uniref:Uncharacterized protein n=1 Tax=Actinokineospora alba TaxID=504798 RepID=A0A1H0RSW9_9PSEU|nr:hypothetical protein [Actinokineospora alba]TDP66931.1 hypothetical protein C8E96_2449 [Actinokineospora alba]SDJ33793.1 hypothetical protein SAMN05421871_113111 [Actinokineospora alba]SDP32557.1 hypothetical protein SAMN05192558_108111 [Actinokineospora alba]